MRIAVYQWAARPCSIAVYTDMVTASLVKQGVEVILFGDSHPIPDEVDLYWDPGTGRLAPHHRLKSVKAPLVVTFHGVANLSLSLRECRGPSHLKQLSGVVGREITRWGWRSFSNRPFFTVAVSKYAKQEAVSCLNLNPDNIQPIYHGVDISKFAPNPAWASREDRYFLHVSQYQPKKNVDAVIEAYRQLEFNDKPGLVVVSPGYRAETLPAGVKLITTTKQADELADLYRNATAFVFPSLHETFGMPTLEAMASGCPVITSNVTACAEVAGDAAHLVNPRSVDEIRDALELLAKDAVYAERLRRKGIEHSAQFTWERSAQQHLDYFEAISRVSDK